LNKPVFEAGVEVEGVRAGEEDAVLKTDTEVAGLGASWRRTAATRPPPSGSSCTRTASSTRSTRPKTPSVTPWTRTACTSNWPCWPANGSAPPSCATRTAPAITTGQYRPAAVVHPPSTL